MVLDTSLLKTQQYKVCIKGKMEQSRERSIYWLTLVCAHKGQSINMGNLGEKAKWFIFRTFFSINVNGL